MDSTAFNVIQALAESNNEWNGCLFFPIDDDSTSYIDLCTQLAPPNKYLEQLLKRQGYPCSSRFRFPASYKGVHSKDKLVRDICRAAVKCGYELVVRSSDIVQGEMRVRLCCRQGRFYSTQHHHQFKEGKTSAEGVDYQVQKENYGHKKKQRAKVYKSTTIRPIEKELVCPFRVTIQTHDDWWYLKCHRPTSNAHSCACHKHHPRLPPSYITPLSSRMNEEELKLVQSFYHAHVSPQDGCNVLSQHSDINWQPSQFRHLHYKQMAKDLNADASSAEKLVDFMNKR